MRKYIKAEIKAIRLDLDQAILNVCSVSGEYMNNAEICVGTKGVDRTLEIYCEVTVKGNLRGDCLSTCSQDNAPS